VRRWLYRILGSAAFALLVAILHITPFGQSFERNFGLSTLYFLRGPVEVPPEAIVIGLDRASIEWLEFHSVDIAAASDVLPGCLTPYAIGRLRDIRDVVDLPRGLHICLIRELTRRGAPVITFDILFRRPLQEDELFAREIAASGRVVLFERIRDVAGPDDAGETGPILQRLSPSDDFAAPSLDTAAFLLSAPRGDFAEGYVRRLPEFPGLGSMPDVVLRHYRSGAPDSEEVPEIQPVWLYGPPKSIPTYTLRDIFDRESSHSLPDSLAATAVFIGISDPETPGAVDHYKIPISDANARDMAGVEIAATAFLNLLHDDLLRTPGIPGEAAVVFLFILAMTLTARMLAARFGFLAVPAIAVGYAGTAWALFRFGHLWLPFAVPLYLGATAVAIMGLAIRYAFARSLVTRLAPKQIADILLQGTVADRRAVRTEQATVMFTDLVGSTSMGDQLTNVDYTRVMNHYYDTATTTIESHQGMVVEFMGDGILAVFSESVTGQAHASRACEAALELTRGIRDAPNPVVDGGEVALRLRIGINTGMTATGDIGAKHRFNFKALGDTVNVAARLEQYGKEVDDGSDDVILVSHVTAAMSDFPPDRFEDLGAVSLRGKKIATGVARLRS